MLFLAELNDMEVWATDIGNAYLEATTQEKLYIIGGSEFGKLEGHILVIQKALYGLRSSGKRWHERLADCLRNEGFKPCKVEPDLWIRPSKDESCYEMAAVYVDDLAFGVKDPQTLLDMLIQKYKFKLKGSGPISFHLGCDLDMTLTVLCTWHLSSTLTAWLPNMNKCLAQSQGIMLLHHLTRETIRKLIPLNYWMPRAFNSTNP